MIEYLLILTLTVAVVTAVSRGVGRPMGKYIEDNVLGVVKCMLRVGQFPTKSFGICQDAIEAKLDVAGNYNKTGGGNSSSNSNGGSNSSDSEDGDDSNGNGGDSNGNSSDDSDSSSKTRVRSGRSTGSLDDSEGSSPFESGTTTRVKINNDDSLGGNKTLKSNFGKGNSGDTTVIVRRIRRKEERIGGSFFIQNDEKSDYEGVGPETFTATSSQKAPLNEFTDRPRSQRFSIPKSKGDGPRTIASDEGVNFSFLGMIKWIIIAAVLFFIVVFAASQLNSIRKGWTD